MSVYFYRVGKVIRVNIPDKFLPPIVLTNQFCFMQNFPNRGFSPASAGKSGVYYSRYVFVHLESLCWCSLSLGLVTYSFSESRNKTVFCNRLFKLPPSLVLFNHKITSVQRFPAEGHLSYLTALAGKDKRWKKCQSRLLLHCHSSASDVGCSKANRLLSSTCLSVRCSGVCLK